MIVAFVVTSLTAFICAIIGYFSLSIPAYLLNDVDVLIIDIGRTSLRKAAKRLKTVRDVSNIARSEALQTFMISLSDQQIVTSIALLIAGYARPSSTTVYSMDVITALVLLSSSVYLETLPLVRRYLRPHFISKNIRVFFMIATFILLALALILQASASWSQNVYFSCGVSTFTWSDAGITGPFVQIGIIIFIGLSYVEAIVGLYYPNDEVDGLVDFLLEHLYRRRQIAKGPTWKDCMRYRAEEMMKTRNHRRFVGPYALRLLESFAFHEFFESFACRMCWLLLIHLYGVLKVFDTRSESSGSIGDKDVMGSGQIIPLVLLILPVLAALEARDGELNFTPAMKRAHG